ncbi:MAG: hypothetical protein NAG76_11535 [Candidatus Pristimantibacillus lignocellulolyticus]|uniref:Uncharacterized protein n=1 Tax=Candidatus Pristimantibacillus lignocellulolyticus TaxID=2994561 RepID=A0A9J6Z8R6_9BACL|nr:MAG: hypothetical protein NAG76_11535 [Candidatus Pristimantibacillus lignocellulolyticus]
MYVVGTRVPDFPSSLHIRCRLSYEADHRYQSPLSELPLPMKVQKVGFQNREDGALLEQGGNASVRGWYTRTGLPKFASYSMSTKLRSRSSLSKLTF